MSHLVYIALGTNLGDRLVNLQTAITALAPEVQVTRRSQIYETPPWGYLDQPAFLNQVVEAQTSLTPHELLGHLKNLEQSLGRKKSILNGPRKIDLDILFYEDLALESPDLTLPHPRIAGRAFVLVPLAELAPDLLYPALGKTIRQMLAEVDTQEIRPVTAQKQTETTQNREHPVMEEAMTEERIKPLNWKPAQGVGYTVNRRPDGGMHYMFTDASPETIKHWREFAEEHLLGSDRLTRNLYDLRQVREIPRQAILYGIELNSDPSARNIRLAVVVANEQVKQSIREIAAGTTPAPGGVEMAVFTDIAEAEAWLDQPLTFLT